jgi:hypothetical protein
MRLPDGNYYGMRDESFEAALPQPERLDELVFGHIGAGRSLAPLLSAATPLVALNINGLSNGSGASSGHLYSVPPTASQH